MTVRENYHKPYLWEHDPKIPQKCYAYFNYKERITNYLIFMEGIILPAPDEGRIRYSQDPATYDLIFDMKIEEKRIRQYDCIPNNATGLLVNQRVLDILTTLCPDDFQAFPAVLRSNPSKPIDPYRIEGEYWLINVTKQVDAIDVTQSILTIDDYGEFSNIRALVFKEGVLQEGPVLLARERLYRPHILVSPVIRDAFRKAKIKGADFLTDELYNKLSFYPPRCR